MDNLKIIYKILMALEKAMDCPNFDISEFSEESLGVSKERLSRYFEMLQDSGLVKGVELRRDVLGETTLMNPKRIRITLKGLEYLQENSAMRKVYNAMKGVTELIP